MESDKYWLGGWGQIVGEFKLLSYARDELARAGILVDDYVIDVADNLVDADWNDCGTVLGLLSQWDRALPALQDLAERNAPRVPLAQVRLLAPVQFPATIFCIAANYHDHVAEMAPGTVVDKATKDCYFFMKSGRHTTSGPDEVIALPATSNAVDWEIELAVVVGREAKDLTLENAMSCIAGYTILNDLSARDQSRRPDWPLFSSDWFGHKMFDGSSPTGPWIVPVGQVSDPYGMAMRLWVNDEKMQDSTPRQMIFDIAEQLVYLSRRVTLRPGDLVATGTPAGVGRPRGIFLKSGDVVKLEIDGIGKMQNRIA